MAQCSDLLLDVLPVRLREEEKAFVFGVDGDHSGATATHRFRHKRLA
jgi:hypothetical protein